MVIVYHGGVKAIKDELAEVKETLDKRYVEVLGQQRAHKVKATADRLLSRECYFDNPEQYNQFFAGAAEIPEDACNKLLIACLEDITIQEDGRIKKRKVKTSPGFYIGEHAFEHSGSSRFTDRPIASYVHEFNHFIWYALQKTPIYLIDMSLKAHLDIREHPFDIGNYLQRLMKEPHSRDEFSKRLVLAQYTQLMTEMYEKSNQVLDHAILESIGIDVPLPWRGQRRGVTMPLPLPDGRMFVMGKGGDPFKGLDDKEVIDRVIQWETYMGQVMRNRYIDNLIDSVRHFKVRRLPLKEIVRQEGNHKKKKNKRR
jgi:hypothetical protein